MHLQAGQCGNQIGAKVCTIIFLNEFCATRAINRVRKIAGSLYECPVNHTQRTVLLMKITVNYVHNLLIGLFVV